jgi:2-oxoisovalerate dehydrogenase E1 component alpha subunit
MPVLGEPATIPDPGLEPKDELALLEWMLLIRALDETLLLLQRQGRIAFFGPSAGQEASIVGSGFVAREQDWIFPALREGGILLMRGFPLERYFGQLFGNSLDTQKGRQMPMHFSSGDHRFVSLSSVIATQLPQAVGCAWAAKIKKDDRVSFGFVGDGGTSEGDFHAAPRSARCPA